jgi:hypothetical protein
LSSKNVLVGVVASLKSDDASLGIDCEDRLISAWFARGSWRDLQGDLLMFFSFSSSHGLAPVTPDQTAAQQPVNLRGTPG